MIIVFMLLFTLILVLLNEFYKYHWNIAIVAIASLLLLSFLMYFYSDYSLPASSNWFPLIKLASVCIGSIICFTFIKFNIRKKSLLTIIRFIFVINIAEASFKSIEAGGVINGLTGFALLVHPALWYSEIMVKDYGKKKQLAYDLSYQFIVAYTIWNIVFVYVSYPQLVLSQICVLSAGIIAAIISREGWGQARGVTISTWVIFKFIAFPYASLLYINASILQPAISFKIQLLSTCMVILLLVWPLLVNKRKK